MIDATALLKDLQTLLRHLEDDLREQIDEHPELDASLQAEHAAARDAGRTALAYAAWREEPITQAAVAWILGAVFVRFLEDGDFLDHPWLSGPGERRRRADDEHTLYFRSHPEHSDRDYLLHVFSQVEQLPAGAELFDRRHNPLWRLPISGDAARELRQVFREIDPASGELVHDFEDPQGDTRFLGDLYQDLSEPARKRYALLQTPEFVESFILDRTLTPAIEEFGWRDLRLIDPTCGSGHFLLGTFHRLLDLRRRHEPGVPEAELAQRALDGVYGVDVNPFAVRIARFRLLVAALRACGIRRLADAPAFRIHVAAGDSLLHGQRFPRLRSIAGVQRGLLEEVDPLRHVFETEDVDDLERILGQQYHAVVGNPPYITPKDKALNAAYRARYGSCSGKYSLVVPFLERFFDLAVEGSSPSPAGCVGLIVANSFMKREFGKKLIEHHLPALDLTHVIDTSGAYIPGHGTPTVILFGRHRRPVEPMVRAVLGIRGEPETPPDPAHGLVWSAMLEQVDRQGSESEYLSVGDLDRKRFGRHPWSLQGGGAVELKERIESASSESLGSLTESIGFMAIMGEEEVFLRPLGGWERSAGQLRRGFGTGEVVRDWCIDPGVEVLCPYDRILAPISLSDETILSQAIWRHRTNLKNRLMFGKLPEEAGLEWFEYRFFAKGRYGTLSITFAEVATHNHFALDRGGRVFSQTAPVIKLPADSSEDQHLELIGLLNSSVACFWMKQMFQPKSGSGIGRGIQPERWMERYQHDGTKIQRFPVVNNSHLAIVLSLDALAHQRRTTFPDLLGTQKFSELGAGVDDARTQTTSLRSRMIALQEDLDWQCYHLYDLLPDDLRLDPDDTPEIALGERAFEIVLARRMARGEVKTTWFERHDSTPITEIPDHWPAAYREIVARRIELIESDKAIRLLERPEYKRRWNDTPWEEKEQAALRARLLDRLETFWSRDDPAPELRSTAHLADQARADDAFRAVAAVYLGREDVDFAKLVRELALGEAVPFLPAQRYKPSGRRKRREWERTWELQRAEDAIDALTELPADDPRRITPDQAARRKRDEVGDIPVPPKYKSADFAKPTYWRLRGKLDVPKERFVLYPGAEREGDPSPVVCWAGWNHLQQAQALATYYLARKDEGWARERLLPLLAGLEELRPWLLQWHNDLDPRYGIGLGTYYADFLADELRELEATEEELADWTPPAVVRKRRTRRN